MGVQEKVLDSVTANPVKDALRVRDRVPLKGLLMECVRLRDPVATREAELGVSWDTVRVGVAVQLREGDQESDREGLGVTRGLMLGVRERLCVPVGDRVAETVG